MDTKSDAVESGKLPIRPDFVSLLLARIDDCECGDAVPVLPDYFDRLRREFLDRVARKQPL